MSGQKTPEEMHETRVEAGKSELGTAGGGRRGGEGGAAKGFGKAKRASHRPVAAFFFFQLTFLNLDPKPLRTTEAAATREEKYGGHPGLEAAQQATRERTPEEAKEIGNK